MNIKDLKVGDVVYIREDVNNPDKKWANKREVEKVKVKWEPKIDKRYYWINKHLEIDWYTWEGDRCDRKLLESGNCFKTKEDAEEKLEKIKEVLKGE
mgnify:CR=1 FL=1